MCIESLIVQYGSYEPHAAIKLKSQISENEIHLKFNYLSHYALFTLSVALVAPMEESADAAFHSPRYVLGGVSNSWF